MIRPANRFVSLMILGLTTIQPSLLAWAIPLQTSIRVPTSSLKRVAATDSWKLVRATNPNSSAANISITKTADTLNSDPDFAGVMVRCGAERKIDVLIILVEPLPPKAHPQVTLTTSAQSKLYQGTMALAGAGVLLPDDAGGLPAVSWPREKNLFVVVKDGAREIKGSISLDGLSGAYANLIDRCSH